MVALRHKEDCAAAQNFGAISPEVGAILPEVGAMVVFLADKNAIHPKSVCLVLYESASKRTEVHIFRMNRFSVSEKVSAFLVYAGQR